jgi:DNA replication protein DnaC
MEPAIKTKIDYLSLPYLCNNWEQSLKEATENKLSCCKFLTSVIENEFMHKQERRKEARLKLAEIPDLLVIATFPFDRQPQLRKKDIMELYDSMKFIEDAQALLFIGPTGCGKTGLATSFLIHAIENEYSGLYIDFKDLLAKLFRSKADHSERKVLKKFAAVDCLLIDEVGYQQVR